MRSCANTDLSRRPARKGERRATRGRLRRRRDKCAIRPPTPATFCSARRCTYFYEPTSPCQKAQPAAGCAAIGGCNPAPAIRRCEDACIATTYDEMAVGWASCWTDATVEPVRPRIGAPPYRSPTFPQLPAQLPISNELLETGSVRRCLLPAERSQAPGRRADLFARMASPVLVLRSQLVSIEAIVQARGSGRVALGGVRPSWRWKSR